MIVARLRGPHANLFADFGAARATQFRNRNFHYRAFYSFKIGIVHLHLAWKKSAVTSMVHTESDNSGPRPQGGAMPDEKVRKDDHEWRQQLTPNQYFVTRQKGTEPPFTGEYEDVKVAGTYKCVCCGAELFRSETKFDSGCGWPSFYAPAKDEALEAETDRTHGMLR